ncbi:hypothetical protein F5Y18DRAFT_440740 [Xylariaceae sp. FL1019]|nr:hypothetical protein F5Y18DRAFT_440740 [Xylariaceae sp. FL1019]
MLIKVDENQLDSQHAGLVAYCSMKNGLPLGHNTLADLLEKFLSVFGLDPPSEEEPRRYHLHRDIIQQYSPWLPLPGDDFNYPAPRFTVDPSSWSAVLRLTTKDTDTGGHSILEFPLAHTARLNDDKLTRMIGEQAVPILRGLWPSKTVNAPKRRLLGPRFTSSDLPEYGIMASLSCADMNAESVNLQVFEGEHGCFKPSGDSRILLPREKQDSAIEPFLQSPISSDDVRSPTQIAHLWSFNTVEDDWIISIPLIASLLCLVTNPNKSIDNHENITPEDRDIAWCLDAIQSFSRLAGPSEGERDLSFTLGTFSDAWMYISYTLPGFRFVEEAPSSDPATDGHDTYSGLRCDRLKFKLPKIGSFQEFRLLAFARVSVTDEETEPILGSPSFVGFILTDSGHQQINATTSDWEERGITSNRELCGISLFQTILWDHLSTWKLRWDACLDQVTRSIETKIEDLTTQSSSKAIYYHGGISRAKLLFTVTHLLGVFRKHIAVAPRTIRHMTEAWTRTYRGLHSDNLGRLSRTDQAFARKNWERLLAHVEKLQEDLFTRIRDILAEVKSCQDAILCVQTCAFTMR